MIRIRNFIAGHHSNQILGIAQVEDIMCLTWNHVDHLDLISANLKLHHITRYDIPLLDQTMTMYHNELRPLAIMPVLTLGDAGLGDVNAHLSTVSGVNQLCEAATIVALHLHRTLEGLLRQIGQIQRKQFLGKGTLRHLRHE